MNLIFDSTKAGFGISFDDGSIIDFMFNDAIENSFIGEDNNAISFYASENVTAVVYLQNNIVNVILTKDNDFPEALSVSLTGAEILNTSGYSVNNANKSLDLTCTDAVLEIINNILILTLNSKQSVLQLKEKENLLFSSLSITNFTTYAGSRPPEFTLEIADDSNFTKPRQTRYGVPVISTVPAYVPNPSSEIVLSTYYTEGIGPNKTTIYFRATSNILIDVNTPVFLQMWLPDGIDTVKPPVSVKMTAVGDGLRFTCSFVFHEEDTISYVDGFGYAAIYVPMTMQGYLPLGMTVNSSGGNIGIIDTPPDPEVFV